MAAIKRRDAREEVFRLLFETEFHGEMSPEEIYRLAMEDRDFEDDRYIRETYFGVREKREELDEVIALHDGEGKSKEEIKERSIHLLEMAGIANCEGVYNMFPHELSGGMRQRVMIAMALSCNPKLIIADEPTTALDVTIQAQILDLLRNLKNKINSSIMLITHDLGVIAEMADYVVVMYAGRVVEKGTVEEIFANPAHPYTIGLMASKPVVGKKVDKLYSIPGKVPNPINMPDYCYFKDRCEMQVEKCSGEYPHMIQLSPTHMVSCYRYFDGKVGE